MRWTRRVRLTALATAITMTVPVLAVPNGARQALAQPPTAPALAQPPAAPVEAVYLRAIAKNTRWVETQWDEGKGAYTAQDSAYVSVLGNAVLLTSDGYEPALTGVDRTTLHDHTIRTIRHYAASNRYNGGTEWGGRIFWDATFESYFVAAARLLWAELDPATRDRVDAIAVGEAQYMAGLEDRPDPRSGGWTTNGLRGGHVGDSKLEEMGNQSMPLAVGAAYFPDDPRAAAWRRWLDTWMSNMTGLPVADEANPTVVAGQTVAERNQAQNIYPGYLTENHGSYNPHYHQSAWVYPARNAVHFLLAGQPLPESLLRQPNGDGMYRTTRTLSTASGVSVHPTVADRFHLYGRDVLPLVGRHLLQADPFAARAELMLAARLDAYVDHPPAGRLTKFSGEPKYEPEARAELAIAYLLHRWRDRLPGGDVRPVGEAEFFAASAGTVDWGDQAGVAAHQSAGALAVAVTKPNYVKFVWLPGHDDWLFDPSGNTPFLLPSTNLPLVSRSTHTYGSARDGYDASATVIATPDGYAGFTTLPDGSAVYASTGLGPNEGVIQLFNLTMAGMPGLDGDRTFSGASGSFTLPAGHPSGEGLGDGSRDVVTFAPSDVRYVRMRGDRPANQYGYSIWTFAVRESADGPDLALGRPASASSGYPGYPPGLATDGNPRTRWAVSRDGRADSNSWLAVDLGAVHRIDRVEIDWETAYGMEYRIQGSVDGQTWQDLRVVTPTPPGLPVGGNWLNVDDRAGFVVRGDRGIWAAPQRVTLGGPATDAYGPGDGVDRRAGIVVDMYVADAAATRRLAAADAPSGGPPQLRASLAGGSLSLFNLSASPISGAEVTVPQPSATALFRGTQRVGTDSSSYLADLEPASARVEAPRFTLRRHVGAPTPELRVEVEDSGRLRVTNLDGDRPALVEITSVQTGQRLPVAVPAGHTREISFPGGPTLPTANLATGRTTYPDSPLPDGMTSPAAAVDGDPDTAWRPGPQGRMVVDLGAPVRLRYVAMDWTAGPAPACAVSVSDDGLAWRPTGACRDAGRGRSGVAFDDQARYVAVTVPDWRPPSASLAELHVLG